MPVSFLSTPSARRATPPLRKRQFHLGYFYPRPPRGGRRTGLTNLLGDAKFLSTPSARRATLACYTKQAQPDYISIHALREEGDIYRRAVRGVFWYFYPRPPRGGRPAQGRLPDERAEHFYPRPPRGGRHEIGELFFPSLEISIHALREEGDRWLNKTFAIAEAFLSTPSARRATWPQALARWWKKHFYPRPPRGGRREAGRKGGRPKKFLSTPSARRATVPSMAPCARLFKISIHALREEGDPLIRLYNPEDRNFYPRPPRGGRLGHYIRL